MVKVILCASSNQDRKCGCDRHFIAGRGATVVPTNSRCTDLHLQLFSARRTELQARFSLVYLVAYVCLHFCVLAYKFVVTFWFAYVCLSLINIIFLV